MNRNRNIKATALALTAGVVIGSASLPVEASSSLAGAVASMYSVNETVLEDVSALSGTNLALAKILKGATEGDEAPSTESASEAPAAETPAPAGEFDNVAIADVNDYVNVRSEPSESGEVVGKLYSNGAGIVVAEYGDWVHLESGNVVGFVKSDFLDIGDEQRCIENSMIVARANTDGLNVRSESNTDSTIVAKKDTGDGMQVIDLMSDDEEWIETTEGFVATDYVDIKREYNSVAESKAEEEARLAYERAMAEAAYRAAMAEAQAAQTSGKSNSSSKRSSGSAAPAPKATRTYQAPTGGNGAAVAEYGKQFIGNPYVYGGTSLTNGTDCSGFVMSVYNQFGVSLPHSSSAQRSVGVGVSASDMQAGDIVCYSGHVGIAIGNGQIVHASNRRDGIKVSNANYRDILSVRRVL